MTYLKLKELTEKFNWQKKEEQIHKIFVFKTFDLAVDFFNLVADAANAHNHHPDILSSYCSIERNWKLSHHYSVTWNPLNYIDTVQKDVRY